LVKEGVYEYMSIGRRGVYGYRRRINKKRFEGMEVEMKVEVQGRFGRVWSNISAFG
jgi:hypothetical protein